MAPVAAPAPAPTSAYLPLRLVVVFDFVVCAFNSENWDEARVSPNARLTTMIIFFIITDLNFYLIQFRIAKTRVEPFSTEPKTVESSGLKRKWKGFCPKFYLKKAFYTQKKLFGITVFIPPLCDGKFVV